LFIQKLQKSGMVPGVGLMHAPFALFPTPFPQSKWNQASDLAPIFNELVDRVSLDGQFLQESLSRFTFHCSSSSITINFLVKE
jgi:glutathione synthase